MDNLKFNVWYNFGVGKNNNEKLGVFNSLKEAQECINSNEHYKKSLFTKKGYASSKNNNKYESFAIYDNQGGRWSIRD